MTRLMLAAWTAIALAGCAQTNYQVYEGRQSVVEGVGGTKEIVGGYEIWDNGNPPRRYKVIGVATIEDFDNMLGRQRMQGAIAEQIKAAGGDAAVVLDGWSQGQSMGTALNSRGQTAFVSSTGRRQVRYQIVTYLDKPSATGTAPVVGLSVPASVAPTTSVAPSAIAAPACFMQANGRCM